MFDPCLDDWVALPQKLRPLGEKIINISKASPCYKRGQKAGTTLDAASKMKANQEEFGFLILTLLYTIKVDQTKS